MKLLAETQDYIHGGTQKDDYTEDEVVVTPCPFCGADKSTLIYVEHGVIGVSQCRDCSLIYTSPRLPSPEQIYWGDSALYYEEARLIFEGKATHHRDRNYLGEIKSIERHRKGGRFLDVGCNIGMLLRLAEKRGWDVVGLEPSPSLASLADKHGFEIYNCFLHEVSDRENSTFDVVAFSDVFEHISEPLPFLREAARLMKDDGVLYVKVPNAKWSIFKQEMLALIGRHPNQGLWDAYEHVVHYTEGTLTRMLEKGGFHVREISTEPPVHTPNWHEYVGHYYQYPTPWFMDLRRKTVREVCYWLSGIERLIRFGSLGYLAQNIVAIASKRQNDRSAQ